MQSFPILFGTVMHRMLKVTGTYVPDVLRGSKSKLLIVCVRTAPESFFVDLTSSQTRTPSLRRPQQADSQLMLDGR